MTFCEVKSGISVTGDKQSVVQIQMLTVIKHRVRERKVPVRLSVKETEKTLLQSTHGSMYNMCVCAHAILQLQNIKSAKSKDTK